MMKIAESLVVFAPERRTAISFFLEPIVTLSPYPNPTELFFVAPE